MFVPFAFGNRVVKCKLVFVFKSAMVVIYWQFFFSLKEYLNQREATLPLTVVLL